MHLMYFTEQPMSAYDSKKGLDFGATALMFSNSNFDPVAGSRLYNEYIEAIQHSNKVISIDKDEVVAIVDPSSAVNSNNEASYFTVLLRYPSSSHNSTNKSHPSRRRQPKNRSSRRIHHLPKKEATSSFEIFSVINIK